MSLVVVFFPQTAIALLAVHVTGLKQWFQIMPGGNPANYFSPDGNSHDDALLYIYSHMNVGFQQRRDFQWMQMRKYKK